MNCYKVNYRLICTCCQVYVAVLVYTLPYQNIHSLHLLH